MTILSRSIKKEIMDDPFICDERIDEALRELTMVGTWLGGKAASKEGVQRILKHAPPKKTYTVLDVGAGGSDIVDALATVNADFQITSVDFNSRACEYSARRYPSLTVVHASVFALPFQERTFDIVHASLFLHHFTESELLDLLPKLYAVSRYGIVINDLRRSLSAYLGILILTRMISRSAMVRNDAPLSVQRGFVRSELENLCALFPSALCTIRRRWAFRWLVSIVKKE